MVVFGQKWLYSVKVVVFWANIIVFGKSGCIRAKLVVYRNIGVFGQSDCNPQRWLCLGKKGCIRAKVVVFG